MPQFAVGFDHVSFDSELPLCGRSAVDAKGQLVAALGLIVDGPTSTPSGHSPFSKAALQEHPVGAGPTRDRLMVPKVPALLPPVNLNVSCAAVQLMNVAVAVPTATV